MRWLCAVTARSLLRHDTREDQRSHLLPLIWPESVNQVQHTTDGMLPEELHGPPSQVCPASMLMERESVWVAACFKQDSRDQDVYEKMRPWVNFQWSQITNTGAAAICVGGEACVDAIVNYLDAFENEGCKHNNMLKPQYELAKRLQNSATLCARFGDSAKEGSKSPEVDGNTKGGKLSVHGCYHDYPECAKNGGSCLEFPIPGEAGAQRLNELYNVQQNCYRAKSECIGCLYDPAANSDALEPWDCPEEKCNDHTGAFAAADSILPDKADCKPSCLGHPACGHDGCGGSCGVCGEKEECNQGSCVYRPFEHRFDPKARIGKDAPPAWYDRVELEAAVDQRMEARDDELSRKVFRDFQPAKGRQGFGRGLLTRLEHPVLS